MRVGTPALQPNVRPKAAASKLICSYYRQPYAYQIAGEVSTDYPPSGCTAIVSASHIAAAAVASAATATVAVVVAAAAVAVTAAVTASAAAIEEEEEAGGGGGERGGRNKGGVRPKAAQSKLICSYYRQPYTYQIAGEVSTEGGGREGGGRGRRRRRK